MSCKYCGKEICTGEKYCDGVDVLVIYDAVGHKHFYDKRNGKLSQEQPQGVVSEHEFNCYGWFAYGVLKLNNLPVPTFEV